MASKTSHIQQHPGKPMATKALPFVSAPGTKIYCARADAAGGLATCDLLINLGARSTVNIQIVWAMTGTSYATDWQLTHTSLALPPVTFFPGGAGTVRMMSTAMTRDAGDYTITGNAAGSGMTGTIMIVALVGENSEDDCVPIDGGWPPGDGVSLVPIFPISVGTSYAKIPWTGWSFGFASGDTKTWSGATPWPYTGSIHVRFDDQFVAGTRYLRVTALPSNTQIEASKASLAGWHTEMDATWDLPVGTTGFYIEVKSSVAGANIILDAEPTSFFNI